MSNSTYPAHRPGYKFTLPRLSARTHFWNPHPWLCHDKACTPCYSTALID